MRLRIDASVTSTSGPPPTSLPSGCGETGGCTFAPLTAVHPEMTDHGGFRFVHPAGRPCDPVINEEVRAAVLGSRCTNVLDLLERGDRLFKRLYKSHGFSRIVGIHG